MLFIVLLSPLLASAFRVVTVKDPCTKQVCNAQPLTTPEAWQSCVDRAVAAGCNPSADALAEVVVKDGEADLSAFEGWTLQETTISSRISGDCLAAPSSDITFAATAVTLEIGHNERLTPESRIKIKVPQGCKIEDRSWTLPLSYESAAKPRALSAVTYDQAVLRQYLGCCQRPSLDPTYTVPAAQESTTPPPFQPPHVYLAAEAASRRFIPPHRRTQQMLPVLRQACRLSFSDKVCHEACQELTRTRIYDCAALATAKTEGFVDHHQALRDLTGCVASEFPTQCGHVRE